MPVIITILIAIVLVMISWTWHNLGEVDKSKKIATIIISFLIVFLLTLIVFNISTNGVQYENKEIEQNVRNVLVAVFTIINGFIIIPAFSKTFGRINDKTIEFNQAKNHFIFLIIIFIIVLVIECSYLKGVQQGILDIYQNAINSHH